MKKDPERFIRQFGEKEAIIREVKKSRANSDMC